MRISIFHDSLTQFGGAERVLEVLHQIFPEATIYTLVIDKRFKYRCKNWKIKTTWLQYVYNIFPKFKYLLPLIPLAIRSFKVDDSDIYLSTSSGFIKNIPVPKNVKHICYCHTPPRFLWTEPEYINQEVPYILRPIVKIILSTLKSWDKKSSLKIHKIIANSNEVQKRISEIYGIKAEVIYPSIDFNFWKPTVKKQNYFLVAGRLQAHKKIDFVIKCFNILGIPLRVVGTGRHEEYLKSIANKNIVFLGQVSDEQLRDEYSGAKAFIYPQVEDFGLMPLEASACGTPTIAYGKGGALETVVENKTGLFFSSYNEVDFCNLIFQFQKTDFPMEKKILGKFSKQEFEKKIKEIIYDENRI